MNEMHDAFVAPINRPHSKRLHILWQVLLGVGAALEALSVKGAPTCQ